MSSVRRADPNSAPPAEEPGTKARGLDAQAAALAEQHWPLVQSIAREHAGRGIETEELEGIGALELTRAALNFDTAQDVPFGVYARASIVPRIQQAIAAGAHSLRVGGRGDELRRQARRVRRRLIQDLGHEPTDDAIADAMGLNPRDRLKLTRARAAGRVVHLSALEGESGTFEVADDERADGTAEFGLPGPELLAQLPEREGQALALRFGFSGQRSLSIDECGQALGCSRESARLLIERGLNRLQRWAAGDETALEGPAPAPPKQAAPRRGRPAAAPVLRELAQAPAGPVDLARAVDDWLATWAVPGPGTEPTGGSTALGVSIGIG